MKVHKVVISVIDFDGIGADGVKEVIELTRYPNRCVAPKVVSVETAEIGQWQDSHPLNFSSSHAAEFARLFDQAKEPAV